MNQNQKKTTYFDNEVASMQIEDLQNSLSVLESVLIIDTHESDTTHVCE